MGFNQNRILFGELSKKLCDEYRRTNIFPDRLDIQFRSASTHNREHLREKADSLNLDIGMIYDDNMRNRIVQLLRNEFAKNELDTIVARRFKVYEEQIRVKAFDLCRFDTLQPFQDSLYIYWERRSRTHHKDYWKYNVMGRLHLDTTAIFQKIFDSLFQEWKEQTITEAKETIQFDLKRIIKLCGAIKDRRFAPPLTDLFTQSLDEEIRRLAEIALVQMHIEPYRKNYFQRRECSSGLCEK